MEYAVVIHHDAGSSYGVIVPDLPGCTCAGVTLNHALEKAREAIEFHLRELAAADIDIPRPSSDAHLFNPNYAGDTWSLIDVNISPFLGTTKKNAVKSPMPVRR